MALEYAHGAIQWLAADTATTVYTVSGLTFQPKAIRVTWCGLQSGTDAVSETVNLQRGVGFATSTSSRRCVGSFSQDTAGTSNCGTVARDDAIACTTDGAGGSDGELDLNSITSDGFTLIVDDAAPANLTVFWEAWGGSDITFASVGDIAEPAATGNQDYAVNGFSPGATNQVVMFAGVQSTAAVNTATAGDSGMCIGYSTGPSGENIVLIGNSDDASTAMDTDGYARGDECLGMIVVAGGTAVNARAALTQFGDNNFRLNWAARAVTDRRYIFLAIKGGSWRVGDYTINGNTGSATATVSGLPFAPKGVSLMGRMTTESTSNSAGANDRMGWGCGSSTSSRRSMGVLDEDATASSACEIDTTIQYDQVLSFPSTAGALLSAYDINAMNSDGFQIIVDTAGGVSSEWQGYLAFGDAPAQPSATLIDKTVTVPQECRAPEYLGYGAILVLSSILSPPQPTLAADEYQHGTHEAVVKESQLRSTIFKTQLPVSVVATPQPGRLISTPPQQVIDPATGQIWTFDQGFLTPPPPRPTRQAYPQIDLTPPSSIWGPDPPTAPGAPFRQLYQGEVRPPDAPSELQAPFLGPSAQPTPLRPVLQTRIDVPEQRQPTITRAFFSPVAATPPPNRPLYAAPQVNPDQRGSHVDGQTPPTAETNFGSASFEFGLHELRIRSQDLRSQIFEAYNLVSVTPTAPPARPIAQARPQDPVQLPSEVWGPQIDAAPFLAQQVSGARDELSNVTPALFKQTPTSVAPTAPPNRPLQAAPQVNPDQRGSFIEGQTPPSVAVTSPPNRPFSVTRPQDPVQPPSEVWGPQIDAGPFVGQQLAGARDEAPNAYPVLFRQAPTSIAVTPPPNRPLQAAPQVNPDQRGSWVEGQTPPSIDPSAPPNRPLTQTRPQDNPVPQQGWVLAPQVAGLWALDTVYVARPQDPPELQGWIKGQVPPTAPPPIFQITARPQESTEIRPSAIDGQTPASASRTPVIYQWHAAPQESTELRPMLISRQPPPTLIIISASTRIVLGFEETVILGSEPGPVIGYESTDILGDD